MSDSRLAHRWTGIWILQGVAAAIFFAAGVTKLAAASFEVQLFAQLALGQWFRVATGLVQIVGALALLHPRRAAICGLWLGATMFCAVVANLTMLHANPVPAIVLMLLNALIVYLRREELASTARALWKRCGTAALGGGR